jgi:hypothetical protein
LENLKDESQVVCKTCGRKIKALCENYEIVSRKATSSCNPQKRKSSAVVTPDRSSPGNRKAPRIKSPVHKPHSRKTLFPISSETDTISNINVDSELNIDDLDRSKGCAIKVLLAFPSGRVIVKKNFDEESSRIIKNLCSSEWKTVINSVFRHQFLRQELINTLESEVSKEIKAYSKLDSCLKVTEPDQLAAFSNSTLCHEVQIYCPYFNVVVRAACGLNLGCLTGKEHVKERAINAVALATSALVRCQNSTMSALAYRMSLILFHSGISHQDCLRLNHLGVCMSPAMTITLHNKMNETFDYKVLFWKRQIEENRSVLAFLNEVLQQQLPCKSEDDMDLEIVFDLSEDSVKKYRYYSHTVYNDSMAILSKEMKKTMITHMTEEDLRDVISTLKGTKIPFYK